MTGPDSTSTSHTPQNGTSQPATPQMIDGKYEVLRQLSTEGNMTLYEVRAAAGVTRRVAWFGVANPADRQAFHAYRASLRALNPQGLTDVVARPGAYYAVWQDVAGTPLTEVLTQPKKNQETVDAITTLGASLAEQGYALTDADIVLDGETPRVAYLRPLAVARPAEAISTLNAPTLSALSGGKIRRPKRPREPGAWLTFLPGLLFLAGAGWLGAQAARIYLNPPTGQIKNVSGQPARTAAQSLTSSGFRVEYTYGDSGTVPVGSVIRQEPAGGTTLPIGRLVTLTVNKPAPLTVPKIEDMTLDQAKGPLKDNVLQLGKAVNIDGTLTSTPKGRIIAQIPAPGATTQRGVPVLVLVSTGVKAKETWIADLRGMTYDQAREHARTAGLVVTEVAREPSDKPENTVLRQNPAPYVRVDVGSPVKLVIAATKDSPPSTPAAPLPIPPRYIPPPAPVEPDLSGTGTTGTDTTGTDTSGTGATQQPAQPDTTQTPTQTTEQRDVTFLYVFPENLPAGTYTVAVQDADGEREVLTPTDAKTLAGFQANATARVRGNAVFVIRANGAEYARVNPQ